MTNLASRRRGRAVSGALVVLGGGVVAYAASDHPFYGGAPGFGLEGAAMTVLGIAIAGGALLPSAWRTRVLMLALSSFFTIAVAEVAMSAVVGPRFRAPYDYSERYLFRLRPGAWSDMSHLPVNGGHRVLHRINSRGFRGDELLPIGSAKRVVVYGDSFIHAFYTPQEETFTEQLERELVRVLATPVEVVNAGTSSYGPDQNMLRMEHELEALAPDLVILAIFAGNDFGDLIRNKMFEVDAQGVLHPRPFVLAEHLRIRFQLTHSESILRLAARKTNAGSNSARHRQPAAGDAAAASMDEWIEIAAEEYDSYLRDDVVTEPSVDRYNADTSLSPNGEAARYRARLMAAVLRRAAELARARSVPFMLLFIPHPVDVLDKYDGARVDTARFPDYRRSNLTDSLESIAVSSGIDFVNLFDTFRARRNEGLYLRGGDDHWAAAGQKVAAKVTAQHILQRGTLGTAPEKKGLPSP
jgi:hypothetical protein